MLCLIQVAAGGRLAVIDALAVADLRPFWETIAAEGHETIIHSGRGELEFCLQAIDRLPARLFDVQIAAGLVGIEYPAGFSTLIAKLLGESAQKHETRTDWRRRPLSDRQIQYALEDVHYLPPIRDALHAKLVELGRLAWMDEEMAAWQDVVRRSLSQERWRRVSGNTGLDARSLAIVEELWKWREGEAQRRDSPARRVLRDDLIVELAKRQTADIRRIHAVRGMERGDLHRRSRRDRRGHPAGARAAGRRVPGQGAPRVVAATLRAGAVSFRRPGQHLPAGGVGPQPRRRPERNPRVDHVPHCAASSRTAACRNSPEAGGRSSSDGCSTTCWPAKSRCASRTPIRTIRWCSSA